MRRRMETKFLRSVYFGGVAMDLLAGHAEIEEAEMNVVLKWISFP